MKKLILFILPYLLVAIGFLVAFVMISEAARTSRENNAYVRVINCIISKNARTRTQKDIEICYQQVESDLSITLKRYDRSN